MTDEKYLTRHEVASYIRVSLSTIDRMLRDRTIPFIQLGKRKLFVKEEIDKWLSSKEVELKA